MKIETPFPVEGTITPKETGSHASLSCASEWVTQTENGDLLQRAVDRAARKYGNGTKVEVRFTDDGHGVAQDYELLGPVDESDESEAEA